jgi:N,N'-diacetyllegionaminate synthase
MDRLVKVDMDQVMKIGKHQVGINQPCFIIAEAGVNHNGSLDLAKKLIDSAVAAGVDAVKFQTFKTEDLILENIEKASYQKVTTSAAETQTQMLKKLEIDKEFHLSLIDYCRQRSITFLSTCYEEKSLSLLIELNLPAVKIASTDTTNLLFLERVAQTKKPVILSTGMCSLEEVRLAYECLGKNGCSQLALLKCTSNYPTEPREVNLKGMESLKQNFNAIIGFSDHTPGIGASPYAVALGAKIVEKHLTLDKNLPGPDHRASLSPQELKAWVTEIRKVEEMLGNANINPTSSEKETKKALQKSLVSKVNLKKGAVISRENIVAKRTGGSGILASESYEALGSTLIKDIAVNQPILWSDVTKGNP